MSLLTPALLGAAFTLAALAPAAAQQTAPAPAASGAASAAAHSDYNGTWDLDVAASDFGPAPTPTKMSMVVQQKGDSLVIATTMASSMGDQAVTNRYLIGGPATTQTVGNGMEAQTSAKWDGPTLTTLAVVQQQGTDIPVTSRWTLAPDGKTLTIARVITTPGGEMNMTLVSHKR